MIKVGLTGGIGVGKTVCADIFSLLGVPVYNSDIEAKLIMITDEVVKDAIKEIFGLKSYNEDGTLNRGHLASLIFSDKLLLAKMNGIVHPAVREHFRKWCKDNQDHKYIIQESALIFETGSYKSFDKVILVHAAEEVRIKRVMKRDSTSEEEVLARIKKQLPQEEKLEFADYVIINNSKRPLIKQIMNIHIDLMNIDIKSSQPA